MSEWTPPTGPGTDPARHERQRKCNYNFKRGWWCSRKVAHLGPCALRPKWWNVRARVRLARQRDVWSR